MKEIKFRGYSKAEQKWVYGDLIKKEDTYYILEKAIGCYSNKKGNNIYDSLGGRFRFELHHVDKDSIGQYICKDINNMKIYEGDLVSVLLKDEISNLEKKKITGKIIFKDYSYGILTDNNKFFPLYEININSLEKID